MEIIEKLMQAIEKDELRLYLRGENPYKIEISQYAPGVVPTDVGKILSKAIYKVYKINPKIKERFENMLVLMLDGTAFDVYMVVLYVISQLFKEKNGLSPFKLDIEMILPRLQKAIECKKEEFQKGVKYPDDFEEKDVWIEIERFNQVCKEEYNLVLIK